MAYCDYAGAALPAREQLTAINERLLTFPLANPHSRHAVSGNTMALVEASKQRIYAHLHTTPEEYDLVFTFNTTHSIHMIAECFVFPPREGSGRPHMALDLLDRKGGPSYVYLLDSHTSVVGAREIVLEKVDTVCCISDIPTEWEGIPKTASNHSLFVMTAMSNFCGRKYPLSAVEKMQERGFSVFLDAASFVSCSPLRLDRVQPHFVGFSFYKMFGYPTGLGALLIHRSARGLLKKNSFAGGTVRSYLPQELYHIDKDDFHRRFEEGTPNYFAMAAVREGYEQLDRQGGIEAIHAHTNSILVAARDMLRGLKHANGKDVVVIYEHDDNPDPSTKGPTIAFNVKRHDDSWVGFIEVEKMADLFGIHLRTGCFCNAGACQKYLGLTNEELKFNFESGKKCGDQVDLIDGRPVGAVRLSFGKDSSLTDIELIRSMLSCCFVGGATSTILPPLIGLEKAMSATLASIFLYPVKSCRGIAVDKWPLSPSGLLHDRRFSIISGGITLTQKRIPRLCYITPEVDLASSTLKLSVDDGIGASTSIEIPLVHSGAANGHAAANIVCTASVESVTAGGSAASAWLSEQLDFPSCELKSVVGSDPDHSPTRSFANDAPYLAVSASSAAVLAASINMSGPQLVERFRPNLVISGLPPFVEDFADVVEIDGVVFDVVGKCTRCEMICIDQRTGEKDPAAILALRDARRGQQLTFGIYLRQRFIEEDKEMVISTGKKIIMWKEQD